LKKIISIVVAIVFLGNDLCYALSPSPGTNVTDTRDAMYALGQKLFAGNYGPGAIDFDIYEKPEKFLGEAPDIQGIEFIKADYTDLPDGWENNPLLQETDLIEAFRSFRTDEANIPDEGLEIIGGYFPVPNGQLGIARIEPLADGKFRLVIHPNFVSMWNHVRENDVWFEYKDTAGDTRTVSAAWGIFYRVAKHEMTDLAKAGMKAKSLGHLAYSPEKGPELILDEAKELDANRIAGRYAVVNEALWMWFLASYAFQSTTRYNNELLRERVKWFFSRKNRQTLAKEFPSISDSIKIWDKSALNDGIKLAQAVNYNFFRDMKTPPEIITTREALDEYEKRLLSVGSSARFVYATGAITEEEVPMAARDEAVEKRKLDAALAIEYEAVLFDVDGTLTYGGELHEKVISSLAEKVNRGIYVGLITGRCWEITEEARANGVFALKEVIGQIKERVDEEKLGYLLCFVENGAFGFNGYDPGDPRRIEFDMGCERPDMKKLEVISGKVNSRYENGQVFISYKEYGMSVEISEGYRNESFKAELSGKIREAIDDLGLDLEPTFTLRAVDIMAKGVKKKNAIRALGEVLNIPEERIATVGDNGAPDGNDFTMLEKKGGFCVGVYSSPASPQISMPIAMGQKGPEASLWLLDNLRFIGSWKKTVSGTTVHYHGKPAEKEEAGREKAKLREALRDEYEAVLLDVDGTLTDEWHVPDEVVDMIAEKINHGIYVGIVSGRNWELSERFLGRDDIDVKNIYYRIKERVTDDQLKYLLCFVENGASGFNGYEKGDGRRLEFETGCEKIDPRKKSLLLKSLHEKFGPFIKLLRKEYGIYVQISEEKREDRVFRKELTGEIFRVTKELGLDLEMLDTHNGIDAMQKGISKKNAIEALGKVLGIPSGKIAAIGDSGSPEGNDYPMLEKKGGFCVGEYASPESLQVSMSLASGFKGPEATLWLLDNMNLVKKEEKNSRSLRISGLPGLEQVWEDSVYHNLRLYQFASELTRITSKIHREEIKIENYPLDELESLMSLVDFTDTDMLAYNIGFITSYDTYERYRELTGGEAYSKLAGKVIEQGRQLLLLLVSARRAGVGLKELFVEENLNYLQMFLSYKGLGGNLVSLSREPVLSMFRRNKEFLRQSIVLPGNKAWKLSDEIEGVYLDVYQGKRLTWQEAAKIKYGDNIPTHIRIMTSCAGEFAPVFFEDPLGYIRERAEQGTPVVMEDRISSVINVVDIIDLPSEAEGKVTKFRMRSGRYAYLKRVNPLRVRYPEEEIDIAERLEDVFRRTDPHYRAQKFIGTIYSEGVFYLLSVPLEKDDAIAPPQAGSISLEDMASILRENDIYLSHDVESGRVLMDNGYEYHYSIDFETFPYLSVNYGSIDEFMRTRYGRERYEMGGDDVAGVRIPGAKKDDAHISAPSSDMAEGARKEIAEIIEYVIDLSPGKGPGAVRELSDSQRINIWQAVNLTHETSIEIYMPRSIKLTKAMRKALMKVNQKMNEKGFTLDVVRYRQEELLSEIGRSKEKTEDTVKRIVITSGIGKMPEDGVSIELLRDVRVLNMTVPEAKDEDRMTVIQARIVMIAILARLLDENRNLEIKLVLTRMLENSFEGSGVDVNDFITRLGAAEDADASARSIRERLDYFMSGIRAISLIKKLEIELRALREFWTYA